MQDGSLQCSAASGGSSIRRGIEWGYGSRRERRSRLGSSGLDESAVALERGQVVLVRSQTNITVGPHREEGYSFDAEESCCSGFKLSDM